MNLICAVPLALSHLDSVSNPLTIIATPLRVLLRMHKGVILFLLHNSSLNPNSG